LKGETLTTLKKNDFVVIDYVGKINGKIFDVTDENLAKKENIYDSKAKYGPVAIVVGAGHLIKGLDKSLEGKNLGTTYSVHLEPEDAFGKKDSKLIKIMSERSFKDQKIKPQAGMQVSVDGILGTVISVSSGRVIIDFNHPLAGKSVDYEITIHKLIEDIPTKIKSLLEIYTNQSDFEINLNDGKAIIKCKFKLPDDLKKLLSEDIKKYIDIKEIEFEDKKD